MATTRLLRALDIECAIKTSGLRPRLKSSTCNERGLLLCCTVVFAMGVPMAHAADAAKDDRVIAEFLDGNGDHHISYDEFVHSVAAKAVRDMDADRDGTVSQPEAAAASSNVKATFPTIDFVKADRNGDGKISLEELKQALGANADVEALFHQFDKDGDGLLSESEIGALQGVPLVRLNY